MNRKTKANLLIAMGLMMPYLTSSSPQGSFAKRKKKPKVNPQTKQTPDINFKGLSKKQKISKLVAMLKRYNEAYRTGAPLIQDIEYDELKERLRALDPKNKWLLSVEPEPPTTRRKVFHNPPMLSTKKTYDTKKVRTYLNLLVKTAKKIKAPLPTVVITPKLDGIAVDWSDGTLSTRGDGEFGGDISHLLTYGLVFLPASAEEGEFRGELVVDRHYFNKHMADTRSQPRSFIAGLANSKPESLKGIKLNALQDGAVRAVAFGGFDNDQSKRYQLTDENIDLIEASMAEIHADLINSVTYDCDGIVLTCIDKPIQKALGRKGDYWQYMLAFKMRGERQVTPVTKVDWSMSRYGTLTPVINFEPVYFNRVTYADGTTTGGIVAKRASGFNFSLCQRRGYGVGAEIVVLMSGDVIPYISEVEKPSTDFPFPKECPYCDTPTEIKGVALTCPNKSCVGALAKRIQLFTDELEMKGFGKVKPKVRGAIVKLVEAGYDRISKILTMSLPQFRKVVGPKTAIKLFHSVQRTFAKGVDKSALIRGLGIAKIGAEKSNVLVRSIPDLDIRRLNEIHRQELIKMKGVGGKTADTIKQSLKQMWPQIQQIMEHDFVIIEPQFQVPKVQNCKTFMFSGQLKYGLKNIQRFTREKGHTVALNFDEPIDFLVIGKEAGGYRLKKAEQLEIPILNEREFFDMLELL